MPKQPPRFKIGYVFDDSLDRDDGVQQYIKLLGNWMINAGHEVRFLVGETHHAGSLQPYVYSLSNNMSVRGNKNRLTIPLPARTQLIRNVLQTEEFDVLHIQMPYSPMLGGKIIRLASLETAVLGTFHIVGDTWFETFGSKLLAQAQKRTLKRFDQVISVSSAAEQFAKTHFGVHSQVVPNAVDVSAFAKVPNKKNDTNTRIVFLGRLVERKGCQYLLHALAQLQKRNQLTGIAVDICGGGPLKKSLEAYVRHHHLSKQVHFHGHVSEAYKVRFLANADIAVFPATGGESFGIVLIEAMATNGPVVLAGNNSGYRTIMRDQPELLFEPTDADGLARLIIRFVSDKKIRQKLVKWQSNHVKQYDVDCVGRQIESAYQRHVKKSKKLEP